MKMCFGDLMAVFIGQMGVPAREQDMCGLKMSQFLCGLDLAFGCALDRDPMQRYRSGNDVPF